MEHNESMRIGLIVTEANRGMIDELLSVGINAEVLVLYQKAVRDHYREVSVFMNDSKGYDLIHCIGSTVPLLFERFVETPVLTTIDRLTSSEEIDLCLQAEGNCFFVSVDGNKGISNINLISDIRVPEKKPGTYYNTIYHQIIQSQNRENHRPWGFYEVLCDKHADHKIKRITLWPGKRLSLQLHKKRSEHWVVVSGCARVTLGKDEIILRPKESVDIPVGAVHRAENISDELLVFIEVQQGNYFGEDDIIRLEDDFGRT